MTAQKGSPTRVEDLPVEGPEPERRADEDAERRDVRGKATRAPRSEEPAAAWETAQRAIAEAERFIDPGSTVPPMRATRGLRRLLAIPVAKLILRAAQLFLRDQRSFNVETIAALRALADALAAQVRGAEARLAADRQEAAEADRRS